MPGTPDGAEYTPRDAAHLATAFSRGVFRALGASTPVTLPSGLRFLTELGRNDQSIRLADAFDRALAITARLYRSEYYYKNTIVNRVVFGRHSPRTAAPLLEVRAGHSIADVVVLNGTSTAYEIKTDYDDYSRLQAQVADYSRCFERTYVIVSPARAAAALAVAPEHIGVISVNRRGSMREERPANADLNRLSNQALFGLLHRSEILRILARTLDYDVDVLPAQLWSRTRDLFGMLPIDLSHSEAVLELRERGRQSAAVAESMPSSLRAMAYDVPMSSTAAGRITRRLAEPVNALLV